MQDQNDPHAEPETTDEAAQEPIDLRVRFPQMRPLKGLPSLFTLNGFGLTVYGKRNFDALTGTYIKTRYLCAVFIPVFAVDAFRVADAGAEGWHFLGREKLGPFARFWHKCVIIGLLLLAGNMMWQGHIDSPEYRGKQMTKQADEMQAEGKMMNAADVYRKMLSQRLGDAATIGPRYESLLRAEIGSDDPKRSEAALSYIQRHSKDCAYLRKNLLPELADMTLKRAAACKSPDDALALLSAIQPSPADLMRIQQVKRPLLEQLHKQRPDDLKLRIDLALIREESGETDGVLELLEPAASNLRKTEGARLYAGALIEVGRLAEAHEHLRNYVKPRVERLKSTETNFYQTYDRVRENAFNELNRTGGPPGFMQRYDRADEKEQALMVEEQIENMLRGDPAIARAEQLYTDASAVVPSLMDLGVVCLHLAQGETEKEKQQALLDESESAFLAMGNQAAGSQEYKFFLGQVYFWSGRESKGRELFDEMLEQSKNDFFVLCELAGVYRQLGEDNQARELLDRAFAKASSLTEKTMVVKTRALLANTVDEKIEWLSKGDPQDPRIAVELNQRKGEKAEALGDLKKAGEYYREAIAGYDKMERASDVLNNTALIYGDLYTLEGDIKHFEASARMISEAAELNKTSSILAFNASVTHMSVAMLRLSDGLLPPKLQQTDPGIGLLSYLYDTEQDKQQIIKRLVADPNYRKSVDYFWKALLLAPKNTSVYAWGALVFEHTGDKESLKQLLEKASAQSFDFSGELDEQKKHLSGKYDQTLLENRQGALQRAESLRSQLEDKRHQALALGLVADAYLSSYALGKPVEADKWLTELQQAVSLASCSSLRNTLRSALDNIAIEQLAREHEDCRALIEANRRLLDAGSMMRLMVHDKGELGKKVRAHQAVVAAHKEWLNSIERFPSQPGLQSWVMAQAMSPDEKLRELVKADAAERMSYEILTKTQAPTAGLLLNCYWQACLDLDENEQAELKKQMVQAGLKLPASF